VNRELAPVPAAPISPLAPALPVASVSAPEPVPPAASVKGVLVEVSLEPREPSGLKRIAGHVPLLGHLHPFRNEPGRDFVSARPAASLKPRVPASMTRSLEGEIAVDVVVSIDNQGLVKNTEITKGAETSLAMLAADAVRSAPWEPAHSGDHNVAMDMVVHYRFNPAE
jgi:outer membrane biosynthesis protein TonB